LIIAQAVQDASISEVPYILSRVPPYIMFTELPPSTRTLHTRQLTIIMVTIKASLCRKYTAMVSESENEIGLLGVGGESVNTVGYLLLRASLM